MSYLYEKHTSPSGRVTYRPLAERRVEIDAELANAFLRARNVRFCVLSFSSDWLYATAESRDIVRALNAAGCRASFAEITTDKGHDAIFLDEPALDSALRGFLASAAEKRGLR